MQARAGRGSTAHSNRRVDGRVPANSALTIDHDKGEYPLARLKASSAHDAAKGLNDLIESRMPEVELIDALVDTDFLHHFLHGEQGRRSPPAIQRRNVLAALVAVGCNIGPTRMAAASGLSVWEISQAADWYLTGDALKAAAVDLVNYAIQLPMSHLNGLGDTCSADGMRFYAPVDILAADFRHLLHGRPVTLCAHTGENAMCLHQEPIPCRLREATFVLDGLMEHETELDPRTVTPNPRVHRSGHGHRWTFNLRASESRSFMHTSWAYRKSIRFTSARR